MLLRVPEMFPAQIERSHRIAVPREAEVVATESHADFKNLSIMYLVEPHHRVEPRAVYLISVSARSTIEVERVVVDAFFYRIRATGVGIPLFLNFALVVVKSGRRLCHLLIHWNTLVRPIASRQEPL